MRNELPEHMSLQETRVTSLRTPDAQGDDAPDLSRELIELHEVTDAFDRIGLPLNDTLQEMLGEHANQQGNRKGSGFTQAGRHLAEFIRSPRSYRDTRIFDVRIDEQIRDSFDAAHPDSYEYLDDTRPYIDMEKLHALPSAVENEESVLIANMIVDIVDPKEQSGDAVVLPSVKKETHVGTCTTAELYFLEFLNDKQRFHSRSGGKINVITDSAGVPVMLEKMNMGEKHSCLTVRETVINGVRLPPGSLVAVDRDEFRKPVFSLDECKGFEFLRLTTLAVSPENRERAFKKHYTFQEENGMPGFHTTTVEDFFREAELMVKADTLEW